MSKLPRSPRKHLPPGALCNFVAKKRKASLKNQADWDDALLDSPVLKKKSALRKFSAPVRVVIDSPPALSTRAATRRMVYNVEPDLNDDEEEMEMSQSSTKTKRSLTYEVDKSLDNVNENGVREKHEDIANKNMVCTEFEEEPDAECEQVATTKLSKGVVEFQEMTEVELDQCLRKSVRLQKTTDESNQTEIEEIPRDVDEVNLVKKKRGKTLLANLTKKSNDLRIIYWNEKGQPIGTNSVQFSSFVGSLVREIVPYTISDWRKISPLLRDVLWASIQVELYVL